MCSEPARMPAKYYIYAGGRWCEVDTRRGRVSGWRQRARFCFLRGGRLEVARTARVLKALRALASGVGSAAKDAAPLLRRRPHRPRRESVRLHHCCSQHLHHSRCDLNADQLSQKPNPTLSASTPLTAEASPRKRKRSTSGDSTKAKQLKSSEKEEKVAKQIKSPQKPKTVRLRGKEEGQIVQSLSESSWSDDKNKKKIQPPQKSRINAKVRSKEEEELVQSLLQSSDDSSEKKTQSQKSKTAKGKSSKRTVQTVLPSNSKEAKIQSQQKAEEKVVQALLQSPKADSKGKQSPQTKISPKSPQKNVRARGRDKKIVQSLQSSSSEGTNNDRAKKRSQPHKSEGSDKSDSSDSETEKEGPCKELVIGDDDVAVLRKFLARGADGTDLDRFDNDEEYKTSVFYKLNPLVVLSRCAPLERLLLQRLSLAQFARQLGLRSVADVTPEKRYRMRTSTRKARRVSIDSETDKENFVRPKRRQLWNRDKELFSRSSRFSDVREKPQITKPSRDISLETNDSESEVKRHIRRHLERRISARVGKSTPVKEKTATKSNDDDSVVISDSTDSDDSSQGTKENKDNDSVVVSDDDSDIVKSRKTRAATKRDDESVVISDDSNSTDGNQISTRRTRSQGPEKRVLREHNKSVVVSDTDSNANENRNKSKKAPDTAKVNKKSIVVADESSDEGQRRRTRSGPDRALKEQNRSVNTNKKRETTKAKQDVESLNETRTTRSSMKGTNETKDKYKAEYSKDLQASKTETVVKRKEDKPVKKEVKRSKIAEVAPIVRDKSVISDTDSSFEISKLSSTKKRKLIQQQLAANRIRNENGRFLPKNKEDTDKNSKENRNDKQKTDEKVTRDKSRNEKQKEKQMEEDSKESDKNRTGNEDDKRRNEKTSAVLRNMFIKPVKVKKSSVPSGREYTPLEDHAIVAWVSLGDRQRMVNGNSIWRELQLEYPRLTSQTRSWHSLRNRYLRYILPSLGSLALPPAQVSRLRAAAAVGKIKMRGERRNSIFSAPRVRSAAVAGRARLRLHSERDDNKERTPPPSPAKRAPSPAPRRLPTRSSTASSPSPQKKKRSHHL